MTKKGEHPSLFKDQIPFSMLNVQCSMFDVHFFTGLPIKNHFNIFVLTVILTITALLICAPLPSQAADETSLEEAIQGFDDDTDRLEDASLDDVIDGFDDDAVEAPDDAMDNVLDGFDDDPTETDNRKFPAGFAQNAFRHLIR